MSLRLVSNCSDLGSFEGHPVSTSRFASRRLRVVGDCNWPREEVDPTPSIMSRNAAPESDSRRSPGLASGHGLLDHAAIAVQAEREDHDLVLLAAYKLAYAERDVDALLNWGGTTWKRAALPRCIAKGWITVRVDVFGAMRSFRVTPEGYRAADLRVPPLSC